MMKPASPSPEAFTEHTAELADVLSRKQDLLRDIRTLVGVHAEKDPTQNVVERTREAQQQGKNSEDIARETLKFELPTAAV